MTPVPSASAARRYERSKFSVIRPSGGVWCSLWLEFAAPNAPVMDFLMRQGVLIKLGTRVQGGVGPDGDIVGFSTVCPHKGFPLNYSKDAKTLSYPGHYSRFDVEKNG